MSAQPLLVASIVVVALIPLQLGLVALRNTMRSHLFPTADGTRRSGVGSRAQRANTFAVVPTPFRRTIT